MAAVCANRPASGLPGILAALTMSFLDAWNALEQPMTFFKNTVALVAVTLSDRYYPRPGTDHGGQPVCIAARRTDFAFGQKYLEQGILAGAVKG